MSVDKSGTVRARATAAVRTRPARTSALARTLAAAGLVVAISSTATGAVAAPTPKTTAKTTPKPAPKHAATIAGKIAEPHAVTEASLASLQRQLAAATAQANTTTAAVLHASAESVAQRVDLDTIAAEQAQAEASLAATASEVYEALPPQGLPDVESLVIDPDEMVGLRSIGASSATTELDAANQAQAQLTHLSALTRSSDALRRSLVTKAAAVYEAQDRARQLIVTMQAELVAQAKAAALAKDQAARAAAAAQLAKLAAAKTVLDQQSAALSLAISPTLTQAGKDALSRQQPLLDTLVAAGAGYPAGYHPTGQTLTGVSSWYGPGFVGRDTASGTPYDPELLTCAMLAVPLGTVIRVTNLANNASADVMVTDRGPYVGNRIIDLSHAAAVAIGNSGLATVRIEILAPG